MREETKLLAIALAAVFAAVAAALLWSSPRVELSEESYSIYSGDKSSGASDYTITSESKAYTPTSETKEEP